MDAGDAQEQQDEEIDSLQYIYEEGQFEVVGTNPYSLQIDVYEENDDGQRLGVRMLIRLPAEYPAVGPDVEVARLEAVSKEQCAAIQEHVIGQMEDYLDMPMIFSLSSAAKEWLQENAASVTEESVTTKDQGFETHTDHPDEDVEVVLRRKGTPVTPESFAQWKAAFDEEMAANAPKVKGKKQTGRQMFESGGVSASSDGVAGAGEVDVDFRAVAGNATEGQEGADEAGIASVEVDGLDMSVWANEDIDLDDEDFGSDDD